MNENGSWTSNFMRSFTPAAVLQIGLLVVALGVWGLRLESKVEANSNAIDALVQVQGDLKRLLEKTQDQDRERDILLGAVLYKNGMIHHIPGIDGP